MLFQLEDLLASNLEDPTAGTIVLWPRLSARIGGVAQFDVLQMQVDARQPLVDEFSDAAIRWRHGRSRPVRALCTGSQV